MKVIEVDFRKKRVLFTFDDRQQERLELVEKSLRETLGVITLISNRKYASDVAQVFTRIIHDLKEGK